jgi:hypothetical protein
MNKLASITIAFAGLVHAFLAPEHFAHAPAHGIFFAVVGVLEIAWAYLFWRSQDEKVYYAGLVIAGGLVVLWIITRYLPAPFEHEVGIVDIGGIVCKVSEIVGILALVALAAQGRITGLTKRSLAQNAAMALFIAFSVGVVTYEVSLAAQPLFPSLAGEGHHEEDEPQHDH